ncbi:hypothetical protein ACTJNK_29755 [Achromobacter anxifer]|uniref:Uncharacterized protein n=1 Tax=Alcaligenes xylosoxydans xylosoxydans TaxID=85698 RepID=A0A424W6E2_ALCXX|nr:hypothetical protein [Achromobacter xylosoxidans]MBC9908316.1 hypothetical protein [Achromobacter xylosoxidans]MBD0872086.1 hypothetical protein [Achromobacter xylosoxidans]QNP87623.1 hypothetical protein IAG39_08980 [Achromobacter xylosoxidans]RPJ88829.1 hypothetical protein DY367_25855 [Achromobacter xylosoxidans]
MSEITVGQTYTLKPSTPRGKPLGANVTAIKRRGLGHTVEYRSGGKTMQCSMGKFKDRLAS